MEGTMGDVAVWGPYNAQFRADPPSGWAYCEGQTLEVGQYQALYAVIGNAYGGTSASFRLPDMRDPKNPGYHVGFGATNPCRYVICLFGIYPMRP
ncbi:MAG: phage tail protein [Candidatus Sericytochromatia bacterium]|nr:phage tail protein [Candidatus Sericytochromatia bacterium]